MYPIHQKKESIQTPQSKERNKKVIKPTTERMKNQKEKKNIRGTHPHTFLLLSTLL